jgi:hypothetical protein
VKEEPYQAGKARTNMRRLEPDLKIMIAVACFLAILPVLCNTLNRWFAKENSLKFSRSSEREAATTTLNSIPCSAGWFVAAKWDGLSTKGNLC